MLCISGTYSQLLDYVIFAALVFYFLTTLALFRLRRLRPDLPRPVKAFGYPVLPALYMLSVGVFMVILLFQKPLYTWPGLLIVAQRHPGVPPVAAADDGVGNVAFVTDGRVRPR